LCCIQLQQSLFNNEHTLKALDEECKRNGKEVRS
jgi:hypothetical protein